MDIPQLSFTKGEVSPNAAARTDAAFYQNALARGVNGFVLAEGAFVNRPGLEFIAQCASNTANGSYLIPFVYNNAQAYLTEFSVGNIGIYLNGASIASLTGSTISGITYAQGLFFGATWTVTTTTPHGLTIGSNTNISGVVHTGTANPNGPVVVSGVLSATQFIFPAIRGLTFSYTSGGTVSQLIAISNPYAFADLPSLRAAQSADTLTVAVSTQPPYQLKRLTVNSFTFTAPTFINGPFQDLNTDGSTLVYASAANGTVTLTASSAIFTANHVGALFTIQEQFFNSITPWEPESQLSAGAGNNPVGLLRRASGNIYRCAGPVKAGSSVGTGTGTVIPSHTFGTLADGEGDVLPGGLIDESGVYWQFLSSNAGCAQITAYTSPTSVTAVIQSQFGNPFSFPSTVVGGPASIVVGPFTFSGDGTTKAFAPLTGYTYQDPSQFYVTVGGVFIDPSQYQISAAASGTITFNTAPAVGTNNISVTQVAQIGASTYWGFGSFSAVQGYPSTVVYFDDRLVFGGTQLQSQTFFNSEVSKYLNFGSHIPQVASDAIIGTINARRQNPIVDLIPLSDLLIGTASTIWRVTHSAASGAITPSDISLLPQNFYGQEPVQSVQTGDTVIYTEWGGRKIRDLVYQFQYDKFVGTELTVFARQMFPYGTKAVRMAFAPEPHGLLYVVRSDGVLCVCTYLPEQQVVAWTRWITAGFFEDVTVLPENGTFSVYVIVRRVVNGATVRYIERFKPREFTTNQDWFFVDSGLTYDGRNTSSTTMTVTGGTTWLANDTGTLTASSTAGWATFISGLDDTANNAIWLNDATGNRLCRLQITAVSSTTVASVKFLDPVSVSVQGVAQGNWTFARTYLTGLINQIGSTVSVCADAATMPQQVVDSTGAIQLPSAGGVVHAGLPYATQIQGLNFTIQNQPPIRTKAKTMSRLSVVVDNSMPFYAGQDFTDMVQAQFREFESYGAPITPYTGSVSIFLNTVMSDDTSVCIQQPDPVPLTILSWFASVDIGEDG